MIVKFPSGESISKIDKYLEFKSNNDDLYNLQINNRLVHLNFKHTEIKFEDALIQAIGGDSDRQVR